MLFSLIDFRVEVEAFKRMGAKLQRDIRHEIADGVMLYPPLPVPCPEHGEVKHFFEIGVFNIEVFVFC